MIKKKLIFCILVFLIIPLVYAGNYGSDQYGSGFYGGEEGVSILPTPSPSSSGGSISCDYDWQCTNWFPSICPESGIQERICANKGDCTGTTGMPNQTQNCKYLGPKEPLFDIYLTLSEENKELCSGNKIKANIKLENYAKVELLDAFMTYWIIDENNKLIAESKDTRAVEKETSFNIELKIPKSTPNGTYRFYAKIVYSGDKTAVSGESFEIISQEKCSLFYSDKFNWEYLIYCIVGLITILLLGLALKIFKSKFRIRNKNIIKTNAENKYKNKIKNHLKRIRSKTLLMILAGSIFIGILVMASTNITGFAISSSSSRNINLGIFGFTLISIMIGFLVLSYRKKILNKIKLKTMNKYPKNSIEGLIKKRAYTKEGDYIGKVREVNLEENKIHSLKIQLDKKHKFQISEILIEYKNIENIGHIVLIKKEILEELKK
jgi:sporulation protein YlmC with PRC-barrel domain